MRRDDQRQAVKNIPLEQLKPFKNHPFQVRDDEEFRRLVESIEIHGVIHPAVARQIGEDCYELISGHRRKAACEVLGYSEMPVLVRSMTDDEAVVNMVDANLQRETILPSERAFAYKMKLVAMSHQGRKGFTSAQLGRKCVGKESRELIAEQVGQSRNQISRYIRLTELIPEILEMVDNRKMALNPAVSISYLDKKQQKLLYNQRLYIGMITHTEDGAEPFADMTVNLPGYSLDPGEAFISGDISKDLQRFIKENKLGKVLPYQVQSGYARWAKVFNLKQMAQTMNYLSEHNLLEYAVLEEKAAAATAHHNELSAQIKAAEKRMAEIAVLRTHIVNYAKTREVYVAYRKAGYSKKFREEHEEEILLHQAAKNAFDEMGVKKLPKVKELQMEYRPCG